MLEELDVLVQSVMYFCRLDSFCDHVPSEKLLYPHDSLNAAIIGEAVPELAPSVHSPLGLQAARLLVLVVVFEV